MEHTEIAYAGRMHIKSNTINARIPTFTTLLPTQEISVMRVHCIQDGWCVHAIYSQTTRCGLLIVKKSNFCLPHYFFLHNHHRRRRRQQEKFILQTMFRRKRAYSCMLRKPFLQRLPRSLLPTHVNRKMFKKKFNQLVILGTPLLYDYYCKTWFMQSGHTEFYTRS